MIETSSKLMDIRTSTDPICPRCGSNRVKRTLYRYPELGVMSKTACWSCGFWLCTCAYLEDSCRVRYCSILYEGAIPDDLPLPMKKDIIMQRGDPCRDRSA